MIATVQCVVLDCPDVHELARSYQALLGGAVDQPDRRWSVDDDGSTLHTGTGMVIAFQRAADFRPPCWPDPARPQQLHLDPGVPDLDAAEQWVLGLGATALDVEDRGRSWRILADPAGHPFCLVRERPPAA